MYRKFKADLLFTGKKMMPDNTVVVTEEDGTIVEILPSANAGEGVEELSGLLLPGLINSHCHLELSHLKGVIPPHTGLIEFLCSVVTKRDFDPRIKKEAMEQAEHEMSLNGIVAVGDICNTADAIPIKRQSQLFWSNFIEVLSFTDAGANKAIEQYGEILHQHKEDLEWPHQNVLSPHAPYSISPKTFEILNERTEGRAISIHNQENPAEDELYRTGGGELLKLFSIFGVNQSPFPITGKSSLQSWLPHFTNGQTILLVHNTFMKEEDLDFALEWTGENELDLVFCICINANLYIENKVPPIELFRKKGCSLILGTDSYSSNWQLDITKEIFAVQEHFPAIPLMEVLQWATSNGAAAFGWADLMGDFSRGKKPGLVLIDQLKEGKLSAASRGRRIL